MASPAMSGVISSTFAAPLSTISLIDASIVPEALRAPGKQQGQLPKADRSDGAAAFSLRFANLAHRGAREFARTRHHPQQNVCVQQNHFSPSQSSSGVIGETTSPTISIFPARQPKISG